jgi:Flp pilus assembly protein TadD
LVAGLAFALGACAPTSSERVRELAEHGVHLYHKGSFPEARETFEAALALAPNDANLMFNLGQCYDQLGRKDRAEEVYEDCLKLSPNHAACRHALTVLLVSTGRRDVANQRVREWMNHEPKLAAPYAEDSWLRLQEGDLVSARGRLQQAMLLSPRDTRTLIDLGKLYEKLGRPERAVVLYERALEVEPNHPAVARRIAELRAAQVGHPHPD